MELPHTQSRQKYVAAIKKLEEKLKDLTSTRDISKDELASLQANLDELAKKYQEDETLGSARYKLYELQAFIYYFDRKDSQALEFIEQAIEFKGESYVKAERLKENLSSNATTGDASKTSKADKRKKLIGLEGWLALFVVGIGFGILLGIINLAGYPSIFSDMDSIRISSPDFVTDITPLLQFEVLINTASIIAAVWLIVLLAKHKRIAKTLAITVLIITPVVGIIDYAWASILFDTYNLSSDVRSELSESARDAGRSFIALCIWVPYFLVSKRVKATLTKE